MALSLTPEASLSLEDKETEVADVGIDDSRGDRKPWNHIQYCCRTYSKHTGTDAQTHTLI